MKRQGGRGDVLFPRDDTGSALVAMIMFGLVASLAVLGLTGRLVMERREVANSLAQTRAYWAALGIDAYVLSRVAQAGWCTAPCNGATVASNVAGYAKEIADLWTWRYPDVGSGYSFELTPVVTTGSASTIAVRTTFQGSGTAPAVMPMATTRPLEIRFGVSGGAATGWGTGKGGNGATTSITSMARPSS